MYKEEVQWHSHAHMKNGKGEGGEQFKTFFISKDKKKPPTVKMGGRYGYRITSNKMLPYYFH